jgi:hypothetical protein
MLKTHLDLLSRLTTRRDLSLRLHTHIHYMVLSLHRVLHTICSKVRTPHGLAMSVYRSSGQLLLLCKKGRNCHSIIGEILQQQVPLLEPICRKKMGTKVATAVQQ